MKRTRFTTDQIEAAYRDSAANPRVPPPVFGRAPWWLVVLCCLGAILIVIGMFAALGAFG